MSKSENDAKREELIRAQRELARLQKILKTSAKASKK